MEMTKEMKEFFIQSGKDGWARRVAKNGIDSVKKQLSEAGKKGGVISGVSKRAKKVGQGTNQ